MTTVFAGPGHGDYTAFQPGAALAMSFDDLKVIEAAGFFASIADARHTARRSRTPWPAPGYWRP